MLQRVLVVTCAVVFAPGLASAQPYTDAKPRRQFVTVSIDWLHTQPLHFLEHPLEDLVGTEVAAVAVRGLRLRDPRRLTLIDVLEFSRRGRGRRHHGLSLRHQRRGDAGESAAASRAARHPHRLRRARRARQLYVLTDARAYDVGAGLFVADRRPAGASAATPSSGAASAASGATCGDGDARLRRGRRRAQLRPVRRRAVGQVRLEHV